MPAKNRIKQYRENSFYHLYNHGVDKKVIFQDQQDYSTFLSYLKTYLKPKEEEAKYRLNNFHGQITLLAYCLMPDHFHFLIRQKDANSMDRFMNSLGTRYTMYFNKKYKRLGPLYQGVYKAVLLTTEEEVLRLSRSIHGQAQAAPSLTGKGQPSSYQAYLGIQQQEWLNTEEILAFFSHHYPNLSYRQFMNQPEDEETED